MRPFFNDIYGDRKRPKLTQSDKSGAKQSFKADCDINVLIARYAKIGSLPPQEGPQAFFDTTLVPDYQSALERRTELLSAFEEQPPEIQREFGSALDWAESLIQQAEQSASESVPPTDPQNEHGEDEPRAETGASAEDG